MAKPSTTGISAKTTGSTLTATEFNTLNTTVNAVIEDYASISEGVDADTLEGSTKAQVQTHAPASHGNEAHTSAYITSASLMGVEIQENKGEPDGYAPLDENSKVPTVNLPEISSATYGETKLWNKTKNDIPTGWHECDGTNGTEDLSLSNPSTDTVYIMYIGGEYTSMTTRPLSVTNNDETNFAYELLDPDYNVITSVEDGSPFKFFINNLDAANPHFLEVIGLRHTDNYQIARFAVLLAARESLELTLTQHVDIDYTIDNGD